MSREQMRAGDAERAAVAERLKAALDEGRLDLDEYDTRLQQTYAAKTFGALDALVADLPGTVPAQRSRVEQYQQPVAPAAAQPGKKRGGAPFVASYGGVVLVCVIIWAMSSLASGEWVYFWPGWMLIPLVFGLIGRFAGRNR
jgi:hypothetical protein